MDAASLNQLRAKYARSLELLQTALQEKDAAERGAEQAEKDAQHCRDRDDRQKRKIEELQTELQAANQELETLRDLKGRDAELEEMREKYEKSKRAEQEYKEQCEQKDETIISLKKKVQQLATKNASLEDEYKQQEEQLENMQSEKEQLYSKLTSEVTAAQQEVTHKDEEIARLNDQLSQADTRNDVLQQQLRRAKQDRTKALQDYDNLKKESKQQSQEYFELRRNYESLEDRNSQLENALVHLQMKVEEIQKTRMGSKFSEFVKVKRENHKLHDQVDALSQVAKLYRDPLKRVTNNQPDQSGEREQSTHSKKRQPVLRRPGARGGGGSEGTQRTFISQRPVHTEGSQDPETKVGPDRHQPESSFSSAGKGSLGDYGSSVIQS
eukprot:gb/GECG01001280.1/.p1 GENE.gb/GECG01001280.1/~~gb/GECG01001280.1/.p1  ORF type:complete len:383 (+),score=78.68 gb/GECG01001280.1/:1-1149(+)